MSDLDPILAAATLPDGSQRFWPPGQHPALARWRTCLEEMRPFCSEEHPQVVHARALIAEFEEGESIAKADYLRRA